MHHILVELAPVPEGRSQILQYAARTDEEGAELLLGAARHRCVAARNHRDALAGKDGQRVLLVGQAGPAQLNAGAGVDHAGTQRKGVDVGGHAEAGVIRHIADAVGAGHGPGDGAGDELGLVYAGVIGADAGVGHLHGAVEDAHRGVLDCRAQAGAHQLGAGGEYDVCAVGDGGFDQQVGVPAGHSVEVGKGLHLALKYTGQLGAAKLVLAGPGTGLRGALMDEGNF